MINIATAAVLNQFGQGITGGTINTSGTGVFRADGSASNILNNVAITGTIDLSSIANSRERIINGATINGAINIANGGILGLDSSLTTQVATRLMSGTAVINLNDAGARLSDRRYRLDHFGLGHHGTWPGQHRRLARLCRQATTR